MPQVTINVNSVNYTVGYDGTFYSPQGLLVALNNLGFGIFYIATDGPINYLTTIDDNDVFGDISTSPDEILLTCNGECLGTGFDGEGSIIASAFIGGDGIFEWIAIGTTTGEAIANVNGLDRESIVGQGSYQFTNLTNGTYFVAIKDNTGNVGVSTGTTVDCTPITTTTTTTTTTAAITTSTTTTTTTAAATSTTTTTTTESPIETSTTTTTTTPVTTIIPGFVSLLDGDSSCSGGEYESVNITVYGTTICNATSIIGLSSTTFGNVFADMDPNQVFYVSDGTDSREFTRDGTNNTAEPTAVCVSCPATTTTTSTTTTTTTPVTTIIPGFVSLLDGDSSCSGGEYESVNITVYGTTICNATSIIGLSSTTFGNVFADMDPNQVFYVSDGTDSREFTRDGINNTATPTFGCVSCPTITTTSTTTTTTTDAPLQYRISNCEDGLEIYNITTNPSSVLVIGDVFNTSTSGLSGKCWSVDALGDSPFDFTNVLETSIFADCFDCVPPAPTTTSTTTTTTTLPGVAFARSSNPFGTNLLACTTGTGDGGLVYQKGDLGDVPIEGAQLYTSSTTAAGTEYNPPVSGIRFMQFGSSNKYAVFVETTGIMGAVFDCNATTTTTTSTTTTTTTLPCECWTVVNEDSVTINYTVTNCDGTEQSPNLLPGATRNHCIQGGSIIVVNSPIGGLLGEYSCGTTCSIAGDCVYCGPSTTTTTTSTTTTTTTPSPTSTTTTSSTTTTTTLAGIGFARSSNTFGTETLACFTGTGDGGLVYQKAELGNIPATGAQLYNSSTTGAGTEYNPPVSGIRFMQFGSSTKYAVFVETTGIMGAVTACNAVSTTTTSTTTTTTTLAPTTTTTTSTTTTTTTAAPTNVWFVNNAAVSAFAACFSAPEIYIWTYGNTFGAGITYYAGNASAPTQPIQPFIGGNFYYANDGFVIIIDDNGNGGDYQPCPVTTTTIPPTEYSQFLDCSGNNWYSFNIYAEDGTSSQVPDNCVFYQGSTLTPVGTQFTDFTPGSGCFCP